MDLDEQLSSLTRFGNWAAVFRVIGSEHVAALLAELGLPAGVFTAPAAVQLRSQTALRSVAEHASTFVGPGSHVAWRDWWIRLLREYFHSLQQDYDTAAAEQTYAWAQRHFLVFEHRRELQDWEPLLAILAGVSPRGNPRVAHDLAGALGHVVERIRADLSPASVRRVEDRIEVLLAPPPSAFETWADELERAHMDAPARSFPSFAAQLKTVIVAERTHRIWVLAEQVLGSRELLALAAWGQAEARARGLVVSDRRPGRGPRTATTGQPGNAEPQAIDAANPVAAAAAWDQLEREVSQHRAYSAEVIQSVAAGVVVDVLGIRGFLPLSRIRSLRAERGDELEHALKALTGRRLTVQSFEVDRAHGRLVVFEVESPSANDCRLSTCVDVSGTLLRTL